MNRREIEKIEKRWTEEIMDELAKDPDFLRPKSIRTHSDALCPSSAASYPEITESQQTKGSADPIVFILPPDVQEELDCVICNCILSTKMLHDIKEFLFDLMRTKIVLPDFICEYANDDPEAVYFEWKNKNKVVGPLLVSWRRYESTNCEGVWSSGAASKTEKWHAHTHIQKWSLVNREEVTKMLPEMINTLDR